MAGGLWHTCAVAIIKGADVPSNFALYYSEKTGGILWNLDFFTDGLVNHC